MTGKDRRARRPRPTRQPRLRTFLRWHTEEQFWRDVYTRSLSAAIVALLIYIVAALAGVVTLHYRAIFAVVFALVGIAGVGVARDELSARQANRGVRFSVRVVVEGIITAGGGVSVLYTAALIAGVSFPPW